MPIVKSSVDSCNNYDRISELYRLLREGLEDVSAGRTQAVDDAFSEIRRRRKH
jgi:hypothetical protein